MNIILVVINVIAVLVTVCFVILHDLELYNSLHRKFTGKEKAEREEARRKKVSELVETARKEMKDGL